jgi:hypothetical protein
LVVVTWKVSLSGKPQGGGAKQRLELFRLRLS